MIKLIGIDLDGTLLYPKRHLTVLIRKNVTFLRRFIKDGGRVILVSGRNPMMQKKIEKKIGHSIPLLGCNGSFLLENGEVKQSYPIPNDLGLQIYIKLKNKFGIIAWFLFDASNEMHIVTHGLSGAFLFLSKMGNRLLMQYKEQLIYGEKNFINTLQNGTYYKLMPVFGVGATGRKRAMQGYMAVKDLFEDKLEICESNNAIEISAKGANKATGLLEYINSNNIEADEVAVVGDSGNDTLMFKSFINSFVMDHASPHVKKDAKHVIHRVYDLEDYLKG